MQLRVLPSAALLGLLTAGCASTVRLQVQAATCLNPAEAECRAGTAESRLIEVHLYQLSAAIDPCALDWSLIAADRIADALGGVQLEGVRSVWRLQVSPSQSLSLPPWTLDSKARFLLALAIGLGHSGRSARLLPLRRLGRDQQPPTLHLRGYDICLDQPCELTPEPSCR